MAEPKQQTAVNFQPRWIVSFWFVFRKPFGCDGQQANLTYRQTLILTPRKMQLIYRRSLLIELYISVIIVNPQTGSKSKLFIKRLLLEYEQVHRKQNSLLLCYCLHSSRKISKLDCLTLKKFFANTILLITVLKLTIKASLNLPFVVF